jgi:pantothenate kinase
MRDARQLPLGVLRSLSEGFDLAPADRDLLVRSVGDGPVADAIRTVSSGPSPSVEEQVAIFRAASPLCPVVELDVAGHTEEASVTLEELWRFYVPLVDVAAGLARRRGTRALVGVAGPPASGKSVFSALLARVLNATARAPEPACVCPMDGFHRPNAYLGSHRTRAPSGGSIPLREIKGAPETFDAPALTRAVRALRSQESVLWPLYDRRRHDPVPDALRIGPEHRIAIVEGNYLLCQGQGFGDVADLLDLRLFLRVPPQVAREVMIARHVRGGRSPRSARTHWERSDSRNYELVMASLGRADLVVDRDSTQAIRAITRPDV